MEKTLVDEAIKRIETWLKANQSVSESRLGLLACANARALERVRNGTASVETLRALLIYIDSRPTRRSSSTS